MEVFHRGGTEDDEKADPECGSLEGDRFVGFFFAFRCVIGLEEHRVEKEREKGQDEKQLDEEDGQIFRMVLDSGAGLRRNNLIDIVEVHATRKEQDDEEDACDFLVTLIEHIGDRLDLFPRDRFLQSGCYGHDEERESANPDDRSQQMEPMIDNRDEGIEVCDDALKGVHSENR